VKRQTDKHRAGDYRHGPRAGCQAKQAGDSDGAYDVELVEFLSCSQNCLLGERISCVPSDADAVFDDDVAAVGSHDQPHLAA
jgi:hypothetical protein